MASPSPSPSPSPAPAGRQAPRRITFVVVAAVVVGVGAAAFLAAGGSDDDAPARWDRQVADLVTFVERERGLDFERPVAVEFLSDEAFRAHVTDDEELSEEDAADLETVAGLFRALGLAEGDLDLRAAGNQLTGEGVVGVYLPEEQRILVRGPRIDPAMRPTIVHELIHALQDQHFGLEREHERSGEDTAFRALVEADALRVERAYIGSLSADEREGVEATLREQAEGADLEGVPAILTELFALPYVFGPPFLDAVVADGGAQAVDDAFRQPPVTEEHLLEPQSYLDDDEVLTVAAPTLREGEEEIDEPDDFGMLSMLLVLGERVPFAQAWAAVDGWAGDASVVYRADGRDCIRIRTELDTVEDAEELLAATEQWVGDLQSARTSRSDTIVILASCDPGNAVNGDGDAARPRTFELAQLRVELLASLKANGLPHEASACVADAVLRDNDPGQLLEVNTIADPTDPRIVALQRQVATTAQRCAAGG